MSNMDNMDNLKDVNVTNATPIPSRAQATPEKVAMYKAEKFSSDTDKGNSNGDDEEYSLNDDRRVKVLSPGALVMKRFFRNSLAVTGLVVLLAMFLFSFLGGLISPYEEDEIFFTTEIQNKPYAGATVNTARKTLVPEDGSFAGMLVANATLAVTNGQTSFVYEDKKANIRNTYDVVNEGRDTYSIVLDGQIVGMFAIDEVFASSQENASLLTFAFKAQALKAYANGATSFAVNSVEYLIDGDGYIKSGDTEIAYVTRYVLNAISPDIFVSREFKNSFFDWLEAGGRESSKDIEGAIFNYTAQDGIEQQYKVKYNASATEYEIGKNEVTVVANTYDSPSAKHWLGTDGYGMDMLTRLMYGGRVSLMIGFIVVLIETVLGVILGGIAGYFGKWIDNLIMRIVDVFYCIPSTPILIMLGAIMDDMKVQPSLRMIYLMLILGFLGWPGIARMVRGQILSLREQEFMTATEACGVRVSRRIFKHLIPNVIPQLIVICTMGLGSTIITEATLSFLGLGVRFPFASWGNIINAVDSTYILTNFWFAWIPAGALLLLTVLAFNLVGDGLRDAFDPKMKR